jgi:hypothetical protein
MLIAIVTVAILVSIPAFGGRHTSMAQLRLRGTWLVSAALGIQIAIISMFDIHSAVVSRSLHASTYLMIGICLALNRNLRWIWVIGIGWACNFAVIAINLGVMPTSATAAHAIGRTTSTTFENSAPITNAHLSFLGDIFATPPSMPMTNVFSIGDLFLVTGFALVVVTASRTSARLLDDKLAPTSPA